MKTLTLIGNGFDLGHTLPTRFDNFIDSNPVKYKNKYDIFRDGNNSWNNIEYMYKSLLCDVMANRSWLDVTEEVEQIIHGYGFTEYGEINYYNYESETWNNEFGNIYNLIKLLNDFERDFHQYLKETCNDVEISMKQPCHPIFEILRCSDTIITFNYTHTIELLYGVTNVIHIHGDLNDKISIGCGALEEIKKTLIDTEYPNMENFSHNKEGLIERMLYYEEDMDGNLVENNFIKRFFDEVVASASEKESRMFSLLDEKNKETLESRQQVINMLRTKHYDKVYIIGHSLGEADFSVFDAINKDANIICSFYGSDDYPDKDRSLDYLKLRHHFVHDEDLYKVT